MDWKTLIELGVNLAEEQIDSERNPNKYEHGTFLCNFKIEIYSKHINLKEILMKNFKYSRKVKHELKVYKKLLLIFILEKFKRFELDMRCCTI